MFKFPQPLFESRYLPKRKICFLCGNKYAKSILYSTSMYPVLPMCEDCGADWNCHGYRVLKRVRPLKLIWKLSKYKITHPFFRPSLFDIVKDLRNMLKWTRETCR